MPPTSSSNFQLIIDAFDDYTKQVGIDLTKIPLSDAVRACDSPNAVFELLQGKVHEFKDYRDGNRKLISWLKPVVQVVHGFSGVLGQAISLVGRVCRFLHFPSESSIVYLQVPFPPASAIFVSVDVLFSVCILLDSPDLSS
jgi:hypothetical protein